MHDFKCDLWSLGVITYEMFANRVPFDKETEKETLESIQNDEIEFSPIGSEDVVEFLQEVSLLVLNSVLPPYVSYV